MQKYVKQNGFVTPDKQSTVADVVLRERKATGEVICITPYHKLFTAVTDEPYCPRKPCGSILLDNCVDNRLIIDLMGHTDIAMTEGHYHRNRRSLERKAQILSSIPEFSSK